MRSGVCGQRGSGGNALSVAPLAMPTRSAPSSFARPFTNDASICGLLAITGLYRPPRRVLRVILSLKYLACEAPISGHFARPPGARAPTRGDVYAVARSRALEGPSPLRMPPIRD